MKRRIGRPVFFVLAVIIIAFALLSTLGISTQYGDSKTTVIAGLGDVRWGIDIRGGVNAGIQTCWYNPRGHAAPPELRIDYTIPDIAEVLQIVEKSAR